MWNWWSVKPDTYIEIKSEEDLLWLCKVKRRRVWGYDYNAHKEAIQKSNWVWILMRLDNKSTMFRSSMWNSEVDIILKLKHNS